MIYTELESYIANCLTLFDQITGDRKAILESIASTIAETESNSNQVKLVFICTHNSRRSHIAQIWAQTAAAWYGIANVETYSGGTEATAFNPKAIEAMRRAGFKIDRISGEDNPRFDVKFSDSYLALEAFSKVYDQSPNPSSDFLAIMTCSQADKDCPVVLGAKERVAIPYEDPKTFDDTDKESFAYDERCRQIAIEMLYIFSKVQ